MKRIKYLTLALIAAISCTFLTSCSEDQKMAIRISGEWVGDWRMNYTDDYGYTFYAEETTIHFYQDGFSSHGWGEQEDYYKRGPYKYLYYRFDWAVRNGVLQIRYRDKDWTSLDTDICDYRLSHGNNVFEGYFANTGSSFYLERLDDPYDWSPYSGNYFYIVNGSYVKGENDSTTVTRSSAPMQLPKIVRMENGLSKKINH